MRMKEWQCLTDLNAKYPYAGELFLTGEINWLTDPIKCILAGSYVYSPAHRWRADIPLAVEIATTGTLTGRTPTLGVADADDISFGAVTGPQALSVIIFKDTGTRANSPLIVYYDSGTGIPRYPSGDVVNVAWSNDQSKIFAI